MPTTHRPGLIARLVVGFIALAVVFSGVLPHNPVASVRAAGNNALQLNGTSQHATLGTAAQLRSATFTLELWLRRTGAGTGIDTGTGGIASAIPLITKGRAEAENALADINYFFGIDATTGRLVADFEEAQVAQGGTAPGLNHPVTGATAIAADGAWHHAAATYDGTTWNLYLDGVLDGSLAVSRVANAATNVVTAVGTAIRTTGAAAGRFDGVVDEVRIWNAARSLAQINATKDVEVTAAQPNLIGSWNLNEGSGSALADSSGAGIAGAAVGSPAWVTGFLAPANSAPVAVANSYSTDQGQALNVAAPGVLGNDTDADVDPLTAVLDVGPAHGSLTLDPNGSFILTPTPGYVGPDSFTYHANDGTADSNVTTVSLAVGDLRGAWLMDGDATDASGWAHNGTLVGSPTFVAGQNGSAIQLNGSTQYLTAADAPGLDLTTGMTLAAWFSTNAAATTQNIIKKATNGATNGYELSLSAANKVFVRLNQTTSGDTFRINSIANYPTGTWIHVAATYDGTNMRLYLNGVLEGSPLAGPGAIVQNSLALGIGAQPDGGFKLNGEIDDARVYGRALSPAEIATLAAPPANTPPTAVDDGYTAAVDEALVVAAPGVLGNDTDPETDPLTAVLDVGPAHGSLDLGANGGFTYTPTAGYSGPDAFTYHANDGTGDSAIATASITVTPAAPAPPTVALNAPTDGAAGTTTSPAITVDVADPNGGTLTVEFWGRTAASGNFTLLATNTSVPAGSTTSTTWTSRSDGQRYEWFAKVNDGTTTVTSATWTFNTAAGAAPVFVGAGDIADCTRTQDEATAAVLAGVQGTVWTAGDNVYPNGTAAEFANCYEPSWGGAIKGRTRPVPGNHDWNTGNLNGYFGYYGAAATDADGNSYYSYDIAGSNWHVVNLDSECARFVGGCAAGGAQETWLRADLAAHSSMNVIAIWHKPRFGSSTTNLAALQPFWDALYEYGVDLQLTGHDHVYERMAPTDPSGAADTEFGVRPFIVGTGGAGVSSFGTIRPTSEVRNATTYGVLKLTLHATTYDWAFLPIAGSTFTDAGTGSVHAAPPAGNQAPVAVADAHSTAQDTPLNVALPGVLGNDTDADSDPLTAVLDTSVSHGSLTLNPNGSFSYTPTAGYAGPDAFTYHAHDGTTDSNTVTVSLTVTPVTSTGLIGHWTMNETSGTQAPDTGLAPPNNAGTLGGPTWVAGQTGNALRFNGTTQYATTPDEASLDISTAITIAAWVKPEKVGSSNIPQLLVQKATTGVTNGYEIGLTGATSTAPQKAYIRFNEAANGDTYRVTSTTLYPTNGSTWIHVAGTWDGTTIRFYYNGVQQGTPRAFSGSIATNALALGLGGPPTFDASRLFMGAMDDVRLYNRALSPAEITALVTPGSNGAPSAPTLNAPANGATGVATSPALNVGVSDPDSDPLTVTWFGRPLASGTFTQIGQNTAVASGTNTTTTWAGLGAGQTFEWYATVDDGTLLTTGPTWTFHTVPSVDPVFVGTGDIASCAVTTDTATGNLIAGIDGTIWTTGDNVYPNGTAADFTNCYAPTPWGAAGVKGRTRPVPGNHDWGLGAQENLAGYFGYYGAAATDADGNSYYSYDIAGSNWHVVNLDTECALVGGCNAGSAQEVWLRADLAANASKNVIAVWHKPRYSSGQTNLQTLQPLWDALYVAGVDILLDGHDHIYERTAPMRSGAALADPPVADPTYGIRQFTVGTGGEAHHGLATPLPTSQVRNDQNFGVLKLTLHATTYDWAFLPIAGSTFTDAGTGSVHAAPPAGNQAPVAVADAHSTAQDTPLNVALPGVLGNDTDADSDPLTAVLDTSVSHGSLTLNPNGSFSYTPTAGYAGPDAFTYHAHDGTTDSNTVTVSLTVTPVTSTGLIGHWTMNETSGTQAPDTGLAPPNNAGTLGGPTWVAGQTGNALRFNGTTQYATTPDEASLDISTAITIAAWVKPEKVGSSNIPQLLVQKATTGVTNGYEIGLTGATSTAPQKAYIRFNEAANGDTYRVTSTTLYPTNGSTWIHVAGTWDGTTIRFYYNGVQQGTPRAFSGSIATNALALGLGGPPTFDASRLFMGAMDDVRLYNRALSPAEITALVTPGSNGAPSAPTLNAPANGATGVATSPALNVGVSDPDSDPLTVTWFGRPLASGTFTQIGQNTAVASGTNTTTTWAGLGAGQTFEWYATVDDGTLLTTGPTWTFHTVPSVDPVFVGTGDIASCAVTTDTATGNLIAGIDGTIWTTGDNVYPNGTAADFTNCYAPTPWGAAGVKGRTRPVPGNHDWGLGAQENLAGYFGYYGAAATDADGNSYYSYDIAGSNWHVVNLDTECALVGGCNAGSAQEVWLRADLAANASKNVIAVWHKPRYSSGQTNLQTLQPLWDALYVAGVDILLDGHDHIYERTAPMRSGAALADPPVADPTYGIRQFTVGTGGEAHHGLATPLPTSQVRNDQNFGVLKLTLHATTYDWAFLPIAGSTFTDAGTGSVHAAPPAGNQAPVAVADAHSTAQDTPLNVALPGVLGNDTDADSDPLTAVLDTSVSHGSLTLNPNGSFSYTPTAGYAGPDAFTYHAHDGTTDSNTVTVSLTVTPVTSTGLIGHWTMNETSGTQAPDTGLAPPNNAGTLGGPTWVAGQTGNALRFNGTTQYATTPDEASLDISTAITIAAWVKPEKVGSSNIPQLLVQKATTGVTNGYEIGLTGATSTAPQKAYIRFNEAANGDTYRVTSTTLYPTNGSTWIHVAGTWDGTTIRFYYNGVQQGTPRAFSGSIATNALALGLGGPPTFDASRLFMGAMDDVRLYNRALSPAEITALVTPGSNGAPSAPTLNAPANGATGVATSPALNVGVSDPDSDPLTVTWFGRPLASGTFTQIGQNTAVASGTNTTTTWAGLGAGQTFEWYATVDDGTLLTTGPTWTFHTVPSVDPVFVGTGDIASCAVTTDTATGNLIAGIDGTIWTTGDNVYPNGTAADFTNCYAPTPWGAAGVKGRTRPVPGNHDWGLGAQENLAGYFGYYGAAATDADGNSYYSYDIAGSNWHVVNLDTECALVGGCNAGSAQEVWLRADLAANASKNVIAVWHKPRYSSGQTNLQTLQPLWDALYVAGVDILLDGHDHIYERTAPMRSGAALADPPVADPTYGIRQFTVGTGGEAHHGLATPLPTSQVRNDQNFGVLKLTLHATTYDWAFLPIAGSTFTDAGTGSVHAAPPAGSFVNIPVSTGSGEKPQSKVWEHDGTWWAVLPSTGVAPSGTWLWKLNPDDSWTNVLHLSASTTAKADVIPVGDVTHILLHTASPQLVSIEYVTASNSYQAWAGRPSATSISLPNSETATIDVDSTGRMWLATENGASLNVYYSDAPYSTFTGPIALATNINEDDIGAVTALPNNTIGVLWSNQTTQRFGFKVHVDGAAPNVWSTDEVPASASALSVGAGMADDHLSVAVAADGTLYAAVKTSYDTAGFVKIALLVRRPAGTWDPLYEVDDAGTRGIVLLNEEDDTVRVVYTSTEGYADVVVKESPTSAIGFGPRSTLIDGSVNDATSTGQSWTGSVPVIAAGTTTASTAFLTQNPTAGLDARGTWLLNEGSGTSVLDSSGAGNDGSIQGNPTWVAGQHGLALHVDGTGDYALVPDDGSLDITGAITIAAWVRPDRVGTQYVVKKATIGGTNGYELSLATTGKAFVRFNQAASANLYRIDSTTSYPIDGTTWVHLAATFDGTTMRLFVNGVEEATAAGPASIAANTLALAIGAQPDGVSPLQGTLDDVRLLAEALSASEISALMSSSAP